MNITPVSPPARLDAAGSFEVTPLRDATPLWLRRACFAVPIATFTAVGTWLAIAATSGGGVMRPVLLVLVALNLFYVGLTGWPTVLGFVRHLLRRKLTVSAAPSGQSSTALLMPVHPHDATATDLLIHLSAVAIVIVLNGLAGGRLLGRRSVAD